MKTSEYSNETMRDSSSPSNPAWILAQFAGTKSATFSVVKPTGGILASYSSCVEAVKRMEATYTYCELPL